MNKDQGAANSLEEMKKSVAGLGYPVAVVLAVEYAAERHGILANLHFNPYLGHLIEIPGLVGIGTQRMLSNAGFYLIVDDDGSDRATRVLRWNPRESNDKRCRCGVANTTHVKMKFVRRSIFSGQYYDYCFECYESELGNPPTLCRIHAMRTLEGVQFRAWSSFVDGYVSGVLTRDEVRSFARRNALIQDDVKDVEAYVEDQIRIAEEHGTSMPSSPRALEGPWDDER